MFVVRDEVPGKKYRTNPPHPGNIEGLNSFCEAEYEESIKGERKKEKGES